MKLDLNKIIELNSQGFTQREVQKYFETNNYQNIQSFLKNKGVKLTWQTKSFKEIDHSFLPRKKEKFFKHNTEITIETKESVAS